MFLLDFLTRISKERIKRSAEIGSPCLAPLSSLKYFVVSHKILDSLVIF